MNSRPASTSLRASARQNGWGKLFCSPPTLNRRSHGPWSLSAAPWGGRCAFGSYHPQPLPRRNAHVRGRVGKIVRGRLAFCPPSANRFSPTLRICWDHREQQIRFVLPTGVDRIRSGVVVGVVMHVTGAADAVARLDVEPDAVAASKHHRGRPDLDLDPHDLAGLKIKPPLMAMIGPIR